MLPRKDLYVFRNFEFRTTDAKLFTNTDVRFTKTTSARFVLIKSTIKYLYISNCHEIRANDYLYMQIN